MSETLKIDDTNPAEVRIAETDELFAIAYGGWGDDFKDRAVRIVRACNSHDKLLAALRAVYQDIELQNVPGGSCELNLMVQAAIREAEKV